jgi:hypothetical protein
MEGKKQWWRLTARTEESNVGVNFQRNFVSSVHGLELSGTVHEIMVCAKIWFARSRRAVFAVRRTPESLMRIEGGMVRDIAYERSPAFFGRIAVKGPNWEVGHQVSHSDCHPHDGELWNICFSSWLFCCC